jgi:hypothetical protein
VILPSAPLLEQFPGWSAQEIATELYVSRRTVVRWRAGGGVRGDDRDRLAHAAGRHPVELWPELLDLLPKCRTCDDVLTGRAGQKFCSVKCRDRDPKKRKKKAAAAKARRQRETPEQRERRLEAARRYKAEARRSVLAAQRAYYQRQRERFIADAAERRKRKRAASTAPALTDPYATGADDG